MAKYNFDCFHFRGYKPCIEKLTCESCAKYAPWSKKVVIVKLGALGDVARTTPLLHSLKKRDPQTHITWVTKRNAKELLETSKNIDRLVFVDQPDSGGVLRLMAEEFDELFCFDKEDAAIGLASVIKAKKKLGFHMNHFGQMAPLNVGAEYSFDLGLSDELKFHKNSFTYQEMLYDTAEMPRPSPMDNYDFSITDRDRSVVPSVLAQFSDLSRPLIGLNTGSGAVFKTKQWPEEYFKNLASLLISQMGANVLFLGGQDENERNQRLGAAFQKNAVFPGGSFSIRQFSGFLEACDLVVTGDTLAMHLALALGTPIVVLFGSTCDQEIELYGKGEKLVSRPPCAPCYKNDCDQPDYMKCMKETTPEQVFSAVGRVLASSKKSVV